MHYFLSYRRHDRDVAQSIASTLTKAGLPVWMDVNPGAIPLGTGFPEKIEQAFVGSRGFIILVGSQGIDGWVRLELDAALTRHVQDESYPILPLLLNDVKATDLPPFLRRFNAVELPHDSTALSFRLQEISTLLTAELPADEPRSSAGATECPFPGLESFDAERSQVFLGRHSEILEALGKFGRTPQGHIRWLQIEGDSGVGKSSLVRAGLSPAIESGWLEGAPKHWITCIFRPGRSPITNLATALYKTGVLRTSITAIEQRLAAGETALRDVLRELDTNKPSGFLLVVDQFEELFTLSEDETATRQLDALLDNALRDVDGPLYLVTTIRSDFLLQFFRLPRLESNLNARAYRYFLAQIGEAGLRDAVFGAVQVAGLKWESRYLAERIVSEAKMSVSGLPLVGYVLAALWERRAGSTLTSASFLELGGLGGALANGADSLLRTFDPNGLARAESLLLSLVKIGRGSPDTRRVVTRSEAVRAAGGGRIGEEILFRLSGGREPGAPSTAPAPPRLISVSEDRIELAHDFLINGWPTLHTWIDKVRVRLQIRDDLDGAAQAWYGAGCPLAGLPSGDQLGYFNRIQPSIADQSDSLPGAVPSIAGANYLAAANELESRRRTLRLITDEFHTDFQFSTELNQLLDEEQRLWPAVPANSSSMAAWLSRATGVRNRVEQYERILSELAECRVDERSEYSRKAVLHAQLANAAKRGGNAQGRTHSSRGAHATLDLGESVSYLHQEIASLESFLEEWQRQQLSRRELVAGIVRMLQVLGGTEGLIKKMEGRRRFAESVQAASIDTQQERWRDAVRSIADPDESPSYKALRITPQLGFVPIGRDPRSRLWEFAHLQTGEVPDRDEHGALRLSEKTGLVFVLLPGGTFRVGATRATADMPVGTPHADPWARPEESPVHWVTLAPFLLSKLQMTQAQWARFAGNNQSVYQSPASGMNPVENVSWDMCNRIVTCLGLQLPTEAQWEYAARAGTTTVWWTGDEEGSLVNAAVLSGIDPNRPSHIPVGSLRPNAFGLHDMLGNVWEWCADSFEPRAYERPVIDLLGNRLLDATNQRVNRGGSYQSSSVTARSASRSLGAPEYRAIYVGLRPAARLSGVDYQMGDHS